MVLGQNASGIDWRDIRFEEILIPSDDGLQSWENIDQFYEDEEGIIWSVIDDGLFRYNSKTALNVTNYLSKNFNLEAGEQSAVNFLMDVDEKGVVWFGTRKGLFKLNLDEKTSERIILDGPAHNTNWRNYILTLKKVSDTLYVGTANGLYLLNTKNSTVISKYFTNGEDIRHRLSSNSIEGIFPELEEGYVWAARASSLFKIKKSDGSIAEYFLESEPYPYPYNFNSATRFDDEIYFTCHGLGLVVFDLNTEEFDIHLAHKEQPFDRAKNVVRSAVPLNDSIMLVNVQEIGNGLFNRHTKEFSWIETPKPMKDGVFINLDRSGYGWASKRGRIFRSVAPIVKRNLPFKHIIDISSVIANGVLKSRPSIEGYSKLELEEGEDNLLLEFAISKDYVLDSVKYQYRLDSGDWLPITDANELRIFDLSEGDHELSIRAVDKEGEVLASREVNLNLFIPFFKSKWFIALSLAIVGFLLFLMIRYINNKRLTVKLKEIDLAKSAFFANISHEFRTPLTLIKGPLEDQLEKSVTGTRDRENLSSAKVNLERLESLVDQMLALSKLESGKMKLQVQPGSIGEFINVQCDAFSYIASEKNIQFSRDIIPMENSWFDHDALHKIVVNLLGNAFKYTPENREVHISAKPSTGSYRIEVQNAGSYLSSAEQEKVFTRFYQSDPNNPGTGIGLSLTKELTELHKGRIHVESKKGVHTRFVISIPMDKDSFDLSEILSTQPQAMDTRSHSEVVEFTPPNLTSTKDAPVVLIVDDNKDIRRYVSSLLNGTFNICLAEDGKQGYDMAITEVPDLVISDVMMPEIDGYAFTELLKTHPLTSHIPVLLLTAKSEPEDRLKGTEKGADAYLTKPFNTQMLKATLQNLLENRKKLQERFTQEILLTPKEIAITSADEQFLTQLEKVLDKHITDSQFGVEEFSAAMGVSRMQLHRKMKALTGQSTTQFLRNQRLKIAKELIEQNKISISEVGYTVGFNDPSYFTKCFKAVYGASPKKFSKID